MSKKGLHMLLAIGIICLLVAPYPSLSAENNGHYQWVIMVYMIADNSLGEGQDSPMKVDLSEMKTIGSDANTQVIVLADGAGNGDTKLYRVVNGGLEELSAPWLSEEMNLCTSSTLQKFVTWCMLNFNSTHYFLDIWNHGEGWMSAGLDREGGIGYDRLTLSEISSALSSAYENTGRKIDIIGFDSCNMAMVEVFYSIAPYAVVAIASEKEEDGSGWPYDMILYNLRSEPTMDARKLGRVVIDEYLAYCKNYSDRSATLSMIDLGNIPKLKDAIDNMAEWLIAIDEFYNENISSALKNAERYDKEPYPVDLLDLCKKMYDIDPFLSILAQNVSNAIKNAVIYEKHYDNPKDSVRVCNASGITVYVPKYGYDRSYDSTVFAQSTLWDEFLRDIEIANEGERKDISVSAVNTDVDGDCVYDKTVLRVWSESSEQVHVHCVLIGKNNYSSFDIPTNNLTLKIGEYKEGFFYLINDRNKVVAFKSVNLSIPMNYSYKMLDKDFDGISDSMLVSISPVPGCTPNILLLSDNYNITQYSGSWSAELPIENAKRVVIGIVSNEGIVLNQSVISLDNIPRAICISEPYLYWKNGTLELYMRVFSTEDYNITVYYDGAKVLSKYFERDTREVCVSLPQTKQGMLKVVVSAKSYNITTYRYLDYSIIRSRVVYGYVMGAPSDFRGMITISANDKTVLEEKIGRYFWVEIPEGLPREGLTVLFNQKVVAENASTPVYLVLHYHGEGKNYIGHFYLLAIAIMLTMGIIFKLLKILPRS